jgi:hypothetical protein
LVCYFGCLSLFQVELWLLLSFYFQKRKENEIETATVDITGIHAVIKCIVRISLIYQSKQIC